MLSCLKANDKVKLTEEERSRNISVDYEISNI